MSWIPSCKLRFLRSLQDRTFILHIYTAPTGESVTKVHNHRDKSVKKILVFQSTRGVAHLPSCCTTANTQKQLCFSSGSLCVRNKSQAIISLLSSRRFAALTDLGRCCLRATAIAFLERGHGCLLSCLQASCQQLPLAYYESLDAQHLLNSLSPAC